MNKYETDVIRFEDQIRMLKNELDERTRMARSAIMGEMQPAFDSVNKNLIEAKNRQVDEQKVIDAAKIAAVIADSRIGQVYCEWENRRWLNSVVATGKRGVCEPYTREHDQLRKVGNGRSRCGELVMRHLKKDGTKSKVWESFGRSLPDGSSTDPYGWFPEGVDPVSMF